MPGTMIELEKSILQEEIEFFNFKWLDSSTIPIADSEKLYNYKVRKES